MTEVLKIPLVLAPQPEGGFTVTSPLLPELITEGDSLEEALANVADAILAVRELYDDLGKPFPANLSVDATQAPIFFEHLTAAT
jgi:antitoxin HicB